MTSFDELIGAEPTGAERERLRTVHELLIEAGPPAEIHPEISGPTTAMTLSRMRVISRRPAFIAAAAAAALVAVIVGVGMGIHLHGSTYPSIALKGASFASTASGTLELLPAKNGQQPMRLEEKGLPPEPSGHYVVWLVRNGQPVAQCGSFTVGKNTSQRTVSLVSPYRLEKTDTWIVTLQTKTAPGTTVLQPLTT